MAGGLLRGRREEVQWKVARDVGERRAHAAETWLPYTHSPAHERIILHVWAWAPDEERLQALLEEAERVSLREVPPSAPGAE